MQWFPLVWDLGTPKEEESKAALVEKLFAGVTLLEEVFVKSSKGKGFFGGETIGFLDIVLGSFLEWVKAIEMMAHVKIFDETKSPALVGWAQRFVANKAIKGVMPEPQELIDHRKMMQARAAAATAAASK